MHFDLNESVNGNEENVAKRRNMDGTTHLTPAKLVFPGASAEEKKLSASKETMHGARNIPRSARLDQVKKKLEQSARKRRVVLEERKMEREKALLAREQATTVSQEIASTPFRMESKEVKKKNLSHLVESQIEVVDDLLKNGKLKDARSFLRSMSEEVHDSLSVGAFWMRLAQIEIKNGNTRRASSVLIHALQHCNDQSMLQMCSDFFTKQLMNGQVLDNLDSLLHEPFATAPSVPSPVNEADVSLPISKTPTKDCGDDIISGSDNDAEHDFSAYLEYNPSSEIKLKQSRKPLLSGKKPLRVALLQSTIPQHREETCQVKKEHSQTGSFLSVAAVKAGKNRESLGSELTLTPVRRSARLAKPDTEDRLSLLKQTNYSYTPNLMLPSSNVASHSKLAHQEEDLLV